MDGMKTTGQLICNASHFRMRFGRRIGRFSPELLKSSPIGIAVKDTEKDCNLQLVKQKICEKFK